MPRTYTSEETVADTLEQSVIASQGGYGTGIGGLAGQQEFARRKQQANQITYPAKSKGTYTANPKQREFERFLAGLISLSTGVGIAYYGIASLAMAWYLPVGIGLLVSLALDTLLKGPLRFLMSLLKWVIISGAVGWFLLAIFGE